MIRDCEAPVFFDFTDNAHLIALKNIVIDTYYEERTPGLDFNTSNFFDALVEKIKSADTPFIAGYPAGLSAHFTRKYKDSFRELRDTLMNDVIPPKFTGEGKINLNEFQKIVKDKLLQALGADSLRNLKVEEEAEEMEISSEGAKEDNETTGTKEVRFKAFLDTTFKGQYGAIGSIKRQFSRGLFTHTLCNFLTGKFVTNDVELNDNIANYKEELFTDIVLFGF